jgi:mRNA-degrading endonuclease RelE of RelBE toxin-antitoxin system
VANRARKYLENLDLQAHESLLIKIECLEYDPYLGDVVKVKGKKDIYRLRDGAYRVFFRLCGYDNSIEILLIDNKAGVKGKKIQRFG